MNRTNNYLFTIVVPVFNEERNILRLENKLTYFLEIAKISSCVLFVNDGSKDKSGSLIKEACKRNPDLFFIELTRNGSLSAALKAGINYTQSQYIGYIDADLQTCPENFNLLLEYVTDYQLFMGIRSQRKDSLVKNISSHNSQ